MKRQAIVSTLAFMILTMFAFNLAADEIRFDDDGWYRWEVPAGHGGTRSCCYSYRNGSMLQKGCNLGHGSGDFTVSEPCDVMSRTMHVFVEYRDGRIREIQPLSSACPVKSDTAVVHIENVSEAQSVRWLEDQAKHNPKMADEAVMAISFHAKEYALESLVGLLEDRTQDQDAREQALFWLVQSDYDEAYAYLDRLLDR